MRVLCEALGTVDQKKALMYFSGGMSRSGSDNEVELRFTPNHMQVDRAGVTLITKLIDATYPDYSRAIPSGGDKVALADRLTLPT